MLLLQDVDSRVMASWASAGFFKEAGQSISWGKHKLMTIEDVETKQNC